MADQINGHTVTPMEGGSRPLYRCTECEKSLSDPNRFANVDCLE